MNIEKDSENQEGILLTDEEWELVQEGLADYFNGDVISLEEFIKERKEKHSSLLNPTSHTAHKYP